MGLILMCPAARKTSQDIEIGRDISPKTFLRPATSEFTYILAGWEGSAHDGAVYRSAQYQHGFITPPGKYWLGDAGYPNSDTILVPYRGTRYHLKEQRLAGKKPENSKELFNLRHASKRNVIERIF